MLASVSEHACMHPPASSHLAVDWTLASATGWIPASALRSIDLHHAGSRGLSTLVRRAKPCSPAALQDAKSLSRDSQAHRIDQICCDMKARSVEQA